MNFIILHGIGGHAGIHWQQWLNENLRDDGHSVIMPELPTSDHPIRNEWLETVNESLSGVDLSNLVIVGHSLGVTTALDFIEQSSESIYGLVSVSGFANDYSSELNSYFLKQKVIDFSLILPKIKHSLVIYGDDDPYVTQTALNEVAVGLNVGAHIIKNGGHLNTDSGFTDFDHLY